MNCHNCRQPLRDGAKFCPKCGAVVKAVQTDATPAQAEPTATSTNKCPKCGHDNAPDAKFCANCRARLGGSVSEDASVPVAAPPPPRPIAPLPQMRPVTIPGTLMGRKTPVHKGSRIITTIIVIAIVVAAVGVFLLWKKGQTSNSSFPKASSQKTTQSPGQEYNEDLGGEGTRPFMGESEVKPESSNNVPPATSPKTDSGFYTAVLGNYSTEQDARIALEKFREKGISQLDYLYSSEWENLRPGWWVVFSGKLPDMDSASRSADALKSKGYESYPRSTGERIGGSDRSARNSQSNFTDINQFFNAFKRAVGTKDIKEVAKFVEFPFDQQGSMMTREEFIKNFSIGNDEMRIINETSSPTKYVDNSGYGLNCEIFAISYKRNAEGYWKWVSIYYGE